MILIHFITGTKTKEAYMNIYQVWNFCYKMSNRDYNNWTNKKNKKWTSPFEPRNK